MIPLSKLDGRKAREKLLHSALYQQAPNTRENHEHCPPQGALDMDSGSPGCKLGLPEHAGQALTFGAYVCHLGTREKVPLRDHYKVMCVGPHV